MTIADEFFSLPPRYRTKKRLNDMIDERFKILPRPLEDYYKRVINEGMLQVATTPTRI